MKNQSAVINCNKIQLLVLHKQMGESGPASINPQRNETHYTKVVNTSTSVSTTVSRTFPAILLFALLSR